jgi:membrane-bound lytic murein transglycosylase A
LNAAPSDRPLPQRTGNPWRTAALAAAAIALAALAVAFWALGQVRREPVAIPVEGLGPPGPQPELPPLRTLQPARFTDLPGWRSDPVEESLEALVASCTRGFQLGGGGFGAGGESLRSAVAQVCDRARSVPRDDAAAARSFYEASFLPYAVGDREDREGLLTGYYEPELAGDRRRRGRFVHPLYLAPADRMVIDLGEFKRDLAGRKVTGMIRGGRFRPYWDRAEIEAGALRGRGLEMLWVDDPVALFFLQIQGSGRVRLPDGKLVRVGYSGQNGHDYTAIGKVLVERGAMTMAEVSLQSIRAWLAAHPAEAASVMDANRSYVFFRVLPGASPVGAQGVELTAGRSLAVDPAFLPYGLPLWLASTTPVVPELGRSAESPLERLVVAQDTGGAIRGPVRADLFLGPGREAEQIAGRMKQPLRLWLLWPKDAPPPGDGEPASAAPPGRD